ncbi:MAG TPA: hypothetical protein VM600_00965 [Actinomycetota bacterium]|nr:hypothetical protein [Actinomycetota bacterium]
MIRRTLAPVFAALVFATSVSVWVTADEPAPAWKGAESMTPIAFAPNPERCGAPPVLEGRFAGDGLDSRGGIFTVTASACFNTETLKVTDLEATDRFSAADTLLIKPADVVLVLDPVSCVATNRHATPFSVAGGTGRYDGASGSGTYHIALNWPACNGAAAPARVWFEGVLNLR